PDLHSFPTRRSSDLRAGTKGNAGQQSTCRAQNRISVSQALERIRQFAVTHPRVGFKISDSKYRSIDAETGRYRRPCALGKRSPLDRKSTRLNSSHLG